MISETKKIIRLKATDIRTNKTVEFVLPEDKICFEGKRKDCGKFLWGVPHRDKNDCYKYCFVDHCES